MNALIDALLDLLRGHWLVRNVRIVNYDRTPAGKLELKIRCRIAKGYQLQVWLHHEPAFQDYAYQLFTDHPVLRWDNAKTPQHYSSASMPGYRTFSGMDSSLSRFCQSAGFSRM